MHFPKHPQWVWSLTGGWWPAPKNYVINTLVTGCVMASLTAVVFKYSTERETRHKYPSRWIPSMLWSREFKDAECVAYWNKDL